MEKHHIIFKKQGGLDFELNYKYLSSENHRGDKGPHKNRQADIYYKKELEGSLRKILINKNYSIEELVELLEMKPKQANKAFKKVKQTSKGIGREDIIKRLLGDRYYL